MLKKCCWEIVTQQPSQIWHRRDVKNSLKIGTLPHSLARSLSCAPCCAAKISFSNVQTPRALVCIENEWSKAIAIDCEVMCAEISLESLIYRSFSSQHKSAFSQVILRWLFIDLIFSLSFNRSIPWENSTDCEEDECKNFSYIFMRSI